MYMYFNKESSESGEGEKTLLPNRSSVVQLRYIEPWDPDYSSQLTNNASPMNLN